MTAAANYYSPSEIEETVVETIERDLNGAIIKRTKVTTTRTKPVAWCQPNYYIYNPPMPPYTLPYITY